ncbi:MAG: alanine racemase [Defluviitaleaceae bacterium]|nr:alanine racemase [Defluviitaleaceae bacterium]
MHYQRAWAEVNLAHISHNLAAIKSRLTPGTSIMGIVKADGYGHGAVPVAQALLAGKCTAPERPDSGCADALGVAICEEGVDLRQNGITGPILIMGFTPEPLLPEVLHHNLAQTVFSKQGADALAREAAKHNKQTSVHIKIDTGMSRLGFLPTSESFSDICEIAANPLLNVDGIFTHCATADKLDTSFLLEQQARFEWVLKELSQRGLNIPARHMANSGAFAQTLRDENESQRNRLLLDFVRIGISLYGYPPSPEMTEVCVPLGLRPAMRLLAQVSSVKEFPAETGISYGHSFITTRPSTIAVLPVGYADGYSRRLSQGGKVKINGKLAPIAGTICMDQCMVDVTDIPGVKPGDTAVLLGSTEDGISADNLADTLGTISYEILCGIGKRVPRLYV